MSEKGRKHSVMRNRGKAVVLFQGPMVVVERKHPWLFVVAPMTMEQDLSPDQPNAEEVHVSRIRRFALSGLNVTPDLVENSRADAASNFPKIVVDWRPRTSTVDNWRSIKLRVVWEGHEFEDSTWEPIEQIFEDARSFTRGFLAAESAHYPVLAHALAELDKIKPSANPSFHAGSYFDFEEESFVGVEGDLPSSSEDDSDPDSDASIQNLADFWRDEYDDSSTDPDDPDAPDLPVPGSPPA
jgi:hypothetical protein